MRKEELIRDLEENVYCRIKPSPLHGVGVFAIREIAKGQNPFKEVNDPEIVKIPRHEIFDNPQISEEVKGLVKSFYSIENGEINFSNHSFNQIDISYFMNTSDEPNMGFDHKKLCFYATRDIKVGEELTTDYSKFSDENW